MTISTIIIQRTETGSILVSTPLNPDIELTQAEAYTLIDALIHITTYNKVKEYVLEVKE